MQSNPAYNGTSGSGTLNQANGSCVNAGVDGIDEDVEYDNFGDRIVGSGYTSTLRRSFREYETPITVRAIGSGLQTNDTSTDNVMNRDDMSGGNLNVDENGNKNSSDGCGQDSVLRGGNDATSSALSCSDGLDGHTHEDAPDYYVLEKSDL